MAEKPAGCCRGLVYALLVGVAAAYICGVGLGAPHLRGDEETYAMVTDGMLESEDWLVPRIAGKPYLNKPPLYPWLAALSRTIVTDIEQAQRTPVFVFAVLTLITVVAAGSVLFNPEVGLGAAGLLLLHERLIIWSSHGFRSGTMESGLCFLAMLSYFMATRTSAERGALRWWSGVGAATALMSMLKPFVGFLWFAVLAIVVLVDSRRSERRRAPVAEMALGIVVSVVLWAPWHLWLWLHTPPELLAQSLDQQVLRRIVGGIPRHIEGPLYYLQQITLSSRVFWVFLPAVIIALLVKAKGNEWARCRDLATVIVLWVGALSLMASKLLWYAFPVFPLLALLIAAEIDVGLRSRPAVAVVQRLKEAVPTAVVVGLVIVAGGAITFGYAGKVEFLAQRTQYLPWAVYSEMSARSQAPDRVLLVGGTQKRGWYYRQRMGARTVADLDQLRAALDHGGSSLVIPGTNVSEELRLSVGLELTARAAVRVAESGQELYLVR